MSKCTKQKYKTNVIRIVRIGIYKTLAEPLSIIRLLIYSKLFIHCVLKLCLIISKGYKFVTVIKRNLSKSNKDKLVEWLKRLKRRFSKEMKCKVFSSL